MIAVLIDKTGKFFRPSVIESDTLCFPPASPWSTTMFAILVSSVASWF